MVRPPRLDEPGGVTHVIARGNERRSVFRDDSDYERYLQLLADTCERQRATVLAYCLMPNHVHLLVRTASDPVSRFVHVLHSRYAQVFNRRHERVGHLFQGRFQGLLIDQEAYLLAVVRYIHRNPVKARLVSSPEDYPWSSHRLYCEAPPPWLAAGDVLSLLAGSRAGAQRLFHRFVIGAEEDSYDPGEARLGAVVGTATFVRAALERSARPDVVRRGLTPESVASAVARAEGLSVDDLRGPSRRRQHSRARSLCGQLGRDAGAIPLARMAAFLRRDPSTLSRDVARLVQRLEQEPREALRYRQLRHSLIS